MITADWLDLLFRACCGTRTVVLGGPNTRIVSFGPQPVPSSDGWAEQNHRLSSGCSIHRGFGRRCYHLVHLSGMNNEARHVNCYDQYIIIEYNTQ